MEKVHSTHYKLKDELFKQKCTFNFDVITSDIQKIRIDVYTTELNRAMCNWQAASAEIFWTLFRLESSSVPDDRLKSPSEFSRDSAHLKSAIPAGQVSCILLFT